MNIKLIDILNEIYRDVKFEHLVKVGEIGRSRFIPAYGRREYEKMQNAENELINYYKAMFKANSNVFEYDNQYNFVNTKRFPKVLLTPPFPSENPEILKDESKLITSVMLTSVSEYLGIEDMVYSKNENYFIRSSREIQENMVQKEEKLKSRVELLDYKGYAFYLDDRDEVEGYEEEIIGTDVFYKIPTYTVDDLKEVIRDFSF